jgi:putative redox protein
MAEVGVQSNKFTMATIHTAKTTHNGKMQFICEVNGPHQITIDTSPAGGGENSGPSPKPLLLTAISGCTGMDVVGMLNKMRVPFSDFSLEVEADLRDEHPRIYTEIRLVYKIKIAPEHQEKMEKAVKLSEEQYCGVSAMLQMVCPVKFTIEYL